MNITQLTTPAFVLDESLLRNNLKLLAVIQERAGIDIILAFKGFAMWSTFPLVAQYLKGASASSLAEARLAFEEFGVKAHTYSPAYLPNEFNELLAYSSHITFNSLTEFARWFPVVQAFDPPISCGLRVNPGYSPVEVDLYNPCANGSRLGIDSDELGDTLPLGVEGLHFHALCESGAEDLERVIAAFETRYAKFLPNLKWINMGGGHLITRKGYDIERTIQILSEFKKKWGLHIILEPGSAIAWETGVLVASVIDIVTRKGITTAMLDTSFTAHMPDTLEMPYRPRILGVTDPQLHNTDGKHLYRLGGVSCLAGDFHAEYAFDKPLEVGDKLVFLDMIHYTMVKTTTFNGVTHPTILIYTEDNEFKLIREFGYLDFKNRLS
jgi:carboxynorspermidine decarboxylase